jgi:predicted aminopeptidase
LSKSTRKIDRAYLQKLKTVDYSKLKPFIKQGIEQFDAAYDALEENKQENLNFYRKKFFEGKIADYRKQAEELSKQSISPDRKRNLETEFEKLRDEFMDFLELQMSDAKEVAEMLAGLKTFNFQVNKEIIPKEDNHVML